MTEVAPVTPGEGEVQLSLPGLPDLGSPIKSVPSKPVPSEPVAITESVDDEATEPEEDDVDIVMDEDTEEEEDPHPEDEDTEEESPEDYLLLKSSIDAKDETIDPSIDPKSLSPKRGPIRHTLILNNTTLICPVELLFSAKDDLQQHKTTLIPEKYNPAIFIPEPAMVTTQSGRMARPLPELIHESAAAAAAMAAADAVPTPTATGEIIPRKDAVTEVSPSPSASKKGRKKSKSKSPKSQRVIGLDIPAASKRPIRNSARKRKRSPEIKPRSVGAPTGLDSDYEPDGKALGLENEYRRRSTRQRTNTYGTTMDTGVDDMTMAAPLQQQMAPPQQQPQQPVVPPRPSYEPPKQDTAAAAAGSAAHSSQIAGYDTLQWIQCDNCMKWRRVPNTVQFGDDEKWFCDQNKWDPLHASCDAAEETYDATEEHTLQVTERESDAYSDEKQQFYNKLQRFYVSHPSLAKSIADVKSAKIGNKEVDLYHLYGEVTKLGGFSTCVNFKSSDKNFNKFGDIFRGLACFDANLFVDAVDRLQVYYQSFLLDYETEHFNVPPPIMDETFGIVG